MYADHMYMYVRVYAVEPSRNKLETPAQNGRYKQEFVPSEQFPSQYCRKTFIVSLL